MTALIVIGIILLFFVFLLSLKATVTIAYREEVALSVRVLCLKIPILPKKEKRYSHAMSAKKARKLREKAAKKEKKKQDASRQKAIKKAEKKELKKNAPKKSLSEILDMITMVRKLAATVIRIFFKRLRIDVARLKIKVATGDAATTAIAYGAITQAVNLLLPVLENVKTFDLPKEADFSIEADFLSDAIEADVELSFSLRVWHLFDVAFGALKSFLAHKFSKFSQQ